MVNFCMKISLFSVLVAVILRTSIVEGKKDDWYQACDGTDGECGYNKKSSLKSTCHDDHEDCREFALAGECLANSAWMELNCRRSCGKCSMEEVLNDDEDEDCVDLHTSCPKWADELECFTNPAYMSRACPKSCWLCVNATDLAKNDGLDQDAVNHRKLFANTDFGLWQSIPEDDPGDTVRTQIAKMGLYVKSLEKIGPGTMCNNRYHECSQWVMSKGCIGEELDFMLTYCSLACQQCDIVEDYQRCRHTPKRDADDPPLYGNANEIFGHLTRTLGGTNLLEDRHQSDDDNQDEEWILSLEHNVLWNKGGEHSTTQSRIEEIVSTIKGLNWKNASAIDYIDTPSDLIPERNGRTAICDSKCQSTNNSLKLLHNKIATMLKVDTEYLMPLEFVHYKRNERFAPHHDYRLHDSWKHSGRRAISVFIRLKHPTKGGSFGFPNLDWLLVEKPQILVWPNISPQSNQAVVIGKMKSEQLPVVEGELYGLYAWVREYPYDDDSPCS